MLSNIASWCKVKRDGWYFIVIDMIFQLFSSKMDKESDLELTKLPFFSKYNNGILELFSKGKLFCIYKLK